MGRRLGQTGVHVFDPEKADYAIYGPGDEVSKEHAALLGDDWPGWAQDDDTDDGDGPPPRAGKGSGAAAWARYAAANGVQVDEDASREDVIAACESAGVATE